MAGADRVEHAPTNPVRITNPQGRSPVVLICDHASSHVPIEFGSLGLPAAELTRHIAWDPGALPVARRMAASLDAVLIESAVSRLVIDCNRPLDASDLIPAISETTIVPGNSGLSPEARSQRVAASWTPFHDAVEALVAERLAQGRETLLVSVHSFTPIYKGAPRPWQIGIIHDGDLRLAGRVLSALRARSEIVTGENEPYSPADRVFFTLERHGRSRGLACAMVEIRNDEIRDDTGQKRWADLLAGILSEILRDAEARQNAERPIVKTMRG